MLEFITDAYKVIQYYIMFLFRIYIVDGVSIGSVFLVSIILWIISVIWVRN